MEEVKKMEPRLSVMRVRKNFAGPYRKAKFFNLEQKNINSKQAFIRHIEKTCINWPGGTYFLKQNNGKIFTRFVLGDDGVVRELHKESPATGMEYPVWESFREARRRSRARKK